MNFSFLERLAGWVWETSWQAGLLALLILAVRAVLGRRLPAWCRHALWLLVLARLALPAFPESRVSIYNWMPDPPAASWTPPAGQPKLSHSSFPAPPVPASAPMSAKPVAASLSNARIPWLSLAWLSGALLFGLSGLHDYAQCWRRTHRQRQRPSEAVLSVFEDAKQFIGVSRARLVLADNISSPAVAGIVRPTVLLPANIEDQLDQAQLRLVLIHELSHIKRFDVWTAWACWLFGAVHWFNPLLWLAFRKAVEDRELACDEYVLARTQDAGDYGAALLRVWETHAENRATFGVVGIFDGSSEIVRRMRRVLAYRRPTVLKSLVGGCALALAAVCTLTGQVEAPPIPQKIDAPPRVIRRKPVERPQAGIPTSNIETEFIIISVANSAIGKVLRQEPRNMYTAARDLLEKGEAKLRDVSKLSAQNGTHAYAVTLFRTDVEPVLSPDRKWVDLNASMERETTKLVFSANLPLGVQICVGSFEDLETGATAFVFVRSKLVEL